MAFDIDPSTDPLQIRRILGLPPLTPPILTPGREIPMAGTDGNAALARRAGGMSLAPSTLDTSATPSAPPVAATPSLKPATLTLPDPNDPKYAAMQPHGLKRVGLTLAATLGGPFIPLATRALEAPQLAYKRDLQAAKDRLGMEDTASQIAERNAKANEPYRPETIDQEYADSVTDAISRGVDPATDPKVTQIAAAAQKLKPGAEPKTVETGDGVYQFNPATQRFDIKVGGPKEKTPEADKPLTDAEITQLNAGNLRRYQVNNPKKPLPPDAVLQKGATQKDADRIEKQFSGTETALATKTSRDQAETDRKTAQDQKARDERQKFVQPYQNAIDTVSDAETYVNSGQPTGPGDYALMNQFQEMIVSGQKAGIRFTQNEQHMLQNAQSWINSATAMGRHIVSGSYFSSDQRKQMLDVMKGIAKRSQKQIDDYDAGRGGAAGKSAAAPRDYGPAGNRPDGSTGTLPDGTKVIVKGGRIVTQ